MTSTNIYTNTSRRKSYDQILVARGGVRSEYNDSTLRLNTREQNHLHSTTKKLDRAQRVVFDDMDKEQRMFAAAMNKTHPHKPVSRTSSKQDMRIRNSKVQQKPTVMDTAVTARRTTADRAKDDNDVRAVSKPKVRPTRRASVQC